VPLFFRIIIELYYLPTIGQTTAAPKKLRRPNRIIYRVLESVKFEPVERFLMFQWVLAAGQQRPCNTGSCFFL